MDVVGLLAVELGGERSPEKMETPGFNAALSTSTVS